MYRETQHGRYAESGYNDHYNDGLDDGLEAVVEYLKSKGIIEQLLTEAP